MQTKKKKCSQFERGCRESGGVHIFMSWRGGKNWEIVVALSCDCTPDKMEISARRSLSSSLLGQNGSVLLTFSHLLPLYGKPVASFYAQYYSSDINMFIFIAWLFMQCNQQNIHPSYLRHGGVRAPRSAGLQGQSITGIIYKCRCTVGNIETLINWKPEHPKCQQCNMGGASKLNTQHRWDLNPQPVKLFY